MHGSSNNSCHLFPPEGLITVITQKGPGLNEPEIFMASGEFKGYELVTGWKSKREHFFKGQKMNSLGIIRVALCGILIVVLSICTYVDLIKYVDSPIGRKDALKYEQIEFFPAVTVCPFADSEIMGALALDPNTTFEQAIDMALSPVVHEKSYTIFK